MTAYKTATAKVETIIHHGISLVGFFASGDNGIIPSAPLQAKVNIPAAVRTPIGPFVIKDCGSKKPG